MWLADGAFKGKKGQADLKKRLDLEMKPVDKCNLSQQYSESLSGSSLAALVLGFIPGMSVISFSG